ncbi:DUF4351 domain-containing protein [Vulcanococcus sp. Clear-D1]|uniref:DUF4351 domain-containing protein n=1 Tax=Vulcanococcus sp. Clear-D1 TaxID=2766970 RepID=UPI0019BCBEE2|nr:DUF4351 domain-containing protein [Vulcanococcus sp. Clear-D1]
MEARAEVQQNRRSPLARPLPLEQLEALAEAQLEFTGPDELEAWMTLTPGRRRGGKPAVTSSALN